MSIKIVLLSFFILVVAGNSSGQTFSKYYPQFDKGDNLVDLAEAPNNSYAFIGGMRMVMVNPQGEITKQWNYDTEGGTTYLHKMVRTSTGKYVILAIVAGDRAYKMIFMSADGQLEETRTVQTTEKIHSLKLVAGNGGGFYVSYLREMPEKPLRLTVHKLDPAGQVIWTRESGDGVFNQYAVTTGRNGGWEAAYINAENQMLKVVQVSESGDITNRDIVEIRDLSIWSMPLCFSRTADGGYFFAGDEVLEELEANPELYLIKADANGNVQWQKLLDVQLHDLMVDLHCDATGVYILSNSGSNLNWLDPVSKTDAALTRISYDGNIVWKKAFGARHSFDLPSKLLVKENELLIGGYGRVSPHIFDAPFLIKASLDGDVFDPHFPHTLQPSGTLQTFQLGVPAKTEEVVSALAMPDGGLLSAIKLIGETQNEYAACLIRTNATGQKQWMQVLNENAIPTASIRKTNDGNYVVLTINYWMGFMYTELIKFDENGKILWRKEPVGKTLEDVVPVPDGGYLLTGSVAGGMFDYSALLLKLDADGNESWRRVFTHPERWVAGTRIALSPNNTVGIIGTSERVFDGYSDEMYLLQTDLNGNTARAEIIKKRDSIIVANYILPTADNHFLITGYSQAYHSADKDAFLLKVNRTNDVLLNRVYDWGLNDEANMLIQLGDTAYCMAGTSAEPKLGNRRMTGFLANIKPDGTNNGVAFLGDRTTALQVRHVSRLPNNWLSFAGSWFKQYGTGTPFTGTYDPGIILSAGEPDHIKNIRLYPNPANSTAWLYVNNRFTGTLQISITSLNGIMYQQVQVKKTSGNITVPLTLSGLAAGIYQVQIVSGNERVLRRLIVQH